MRLLKVRKVVLPPGCDRNVPLSKETHTESETDCRDPRRKIFLVRKPLENIEALIYGSFQVVRLGGNRRQQYQHKPGNFRRLLRRSRSLFYNRVCRAVYTSSGMDSHVDDGELVLSGKYDPTIDSALDRPSRPLMLRW